MVQQDRRTHTVADAEDDILFESNLGARVVNLNRPKKLNSLNESMCRKLLARLLEYEKSNLATSIILRGKGKAFCAGGDVASLAEQCKNGNQQQGRDFFHLEYQLDHVIATYKKPIVAVMHGVTMGGGCGLALHTPLRIATETTQFAMPETIISLFPDVGSSHFLPMLDGNLGLYLGLTSHNLRGYDNVYAGLATHYVASEQLDACVERLASMESASLADLDGAIREYESHPPNDYTFPLSGSTRDAIERCFGSKKSLTEIIKALETEDTEWARTTLATIEKRSPASLFVFHRQFHESRDKNWTIYESFRTDYKLACRFLDHPDFVTGVTARLMTKPPVDPTWSIPLSALRDGGSASSLTDPFFTEDPKIAWKPARGGTHPDQLAAQDHDSRMRFTKFGLPTEEAVRQVVTGENPSAGSVGSSVEEVADWFDRELDGKLGARAKVLEILRRNTTSNNGFAQWKY